MTSLNSTRIRELAADYGIKCAKIYSEKRADGKRRIKLFDVSLVKTRSGKKATAFESNATYHVFLDVLTIEGAVGHEIIKGTPLNKNRTSLVVILKEDTAPVKAKLDRRASRAPKTETKNAPTVESAQAEALKNVAMVIDDVRHNTLTKLRRAIKVVLDECQEKVEEIENSNDVGES